jgi:arginase
MAAADSGCQQGPQVLKDSSLLKQMLQQNHIHSQWDAILTPSNVTQDKLITVSTHCKNLATSVAALVKANQFFTVFGGDHSCAAGTWSGAASAIEAQGDLGLIWIDAHMDSHTPETSQTGNIHGMPLAALLGHGFPELTQILFATSKLKPENLCLIGVRSFEEGEEELLKRLGVRIYYMDEVKKRGLKTIMQEAINLVTHRTYAYGVTLDIDSIDPSEAPGTGVKEPDGLSAVELCEAITLIAGDKRLIGTEIVEFDPKRDKDQMTEKLVGSLLLAMIKGV